MKVNPLADCSFTGEENANDSGVKQEPGYEDDESSRGYNQNGEDNSRQADDGRYDEYGEEGMVEDN